MHCHKILIIDLSGLVSYELASRKWDNLCRANFMEAQEKGTNRGNQKERGQPIFPKIWCRGSAVRFYIAGSIIPGY